MITEQLTQRIVHAIKMIPVQFPQGARDPRWTEAVKLAVGGIGKELEYGVCGTDTHFEAGWLFDLCWYERAPDGHFLSMPLVLESEWQRDLTGILYDFEKLFVAKAAYKVMVFQASGAAIDQYFDALAKAARAFQKTSSDELYILACLDLGSDPTVFKCRQFRT